MVEHLSVQNYALIEQLELPLSDGFNVLSGETGAGKSILIGAVGLLLGERGDAQAIRTGAESAAVSAVILLPDHPQVHQWMEDRGIEPEDNRVILRRVIRANGKNTITVQGTPAAQRELKEFSQLLVDVHGQHEHQSLLNSETQREMLDSYGKLTREVQQVGEKFLKLTRLRREIDEISADERDRLRERDMLTYALEEIEAAALQPGEEEELERKIQLMSQFEQFISSVESARGAVKGSLDQLQEARTAVSRAAEIDEHLESESKRTEGLIYELEDIYETLRARGEQVHVEPGELDELQERQQVIRKLEKKYGDSIETVLAYAEETRTRLELLDSSDERRETLEAEYRILLESLKHDCRELSEKRREVAGELEKRITELLRQLGMPQGNFFIRVYDRADDQGQRVFGRTGSDCVSLEISPNLGEPAKPVNRIASGGEISRVMLALKSVFAQADTMDTVIFDEIDAGIGGSVAGNVGMHLRQLGEHRQVICITHVASIAARAKAHFVVDKQITGERTVTTVRRITGEERTAEIARMLSGDSDHQAALVHARELLAD